MSAFRKVAITEPLVDVVDNAQVVTNNYCLKENDLYTVEVEDLTWKSYYQIRCLRNDYIQDAFTVKIVEEMTGYFFVALNARNERDLDFKIKMEFHRDVCDLVEENIYTTH
ncbi:unnamed protein product [Cylicocyclus nassatus]|uniref:Protein arginine N-methyltransferase domain-containing protein n=1 Tax=Cylicocyclus nassatus TaxID=53992 RepID=A0AA36H859_CYLNA|nr:unnamed protein product [Cylicocyclus nassatus]